MGGHDGIRLTAQQAADRVAQLSVTWTLDSDARTIERTIRCKGYAKAVYIANLAAFHGDRRGHHPDVSFGFGYCRIVYTTHDVDGLTDSDFVCAAAFDALFD